MSTIEITGDYSTNQSLSFHEEIGFHLMGAGDASLTDTGATLDIFTSSTDSGILADNNGAAVIDLHTDYTFTSQFSGTAYAVNMTATGGSTFTGAGTLNVNSSSTAIGVRGSTLTATQTGDMSVYARDDTAAYIITQGVLDNSSTWDVHARDIAFGVGLMGSGAITNSGSITTHAGGMEAAIVLQQGSFVTIDNSGELIGRSARADSYGIVVGSGGVPGAFAGLFGDQAPQQQAPVPPGIHIDNSGLIHADAAIYASEFVLSMFVDNTGQIIGSVVLGDAADTVTNEGIIRGVVQLGDGADSYIGLSGRQLSFVDGAGGDDLIVGGRSNDDLRGGSGDDVLNGGKGDDTLAGGIGADTFRFSDGGHTVTTDTITDLDSADTIDLSRIDADTSTGTDDPFHFVSSFDGHAAQATLTYDSVAGHTTLALDTDGDGTADALVLLNGDQTGFTNFVL